MAQSGYIYVLYNASANGLVKIGKTQRNPEERAKELSSATGVPTPFVVVYQRFFQDCDKAEIFIHTKLGKYRLAENREFFQLPIYLAIDAILEAEKFLDKSQNLLFESGDLSNSHTEYVDEDLSDSLALVESSDPALEILEAADSYYYGFEDTIQDYDEAFSLYQKAAKLGAAKAFLQLGRMCRDGKGHPEDNRRALEFFKEGIRHGNDECWAEMAQIFYLDGHKSNEEKCWSQYFSSEYFSNFSFLNRNPAVATYIRHCVLDNRPIKYKEQITQVRNEVLDFLNQVMEDAKRNNGDTDLIQKCLWAVKRLS